MSDDTKGCSGFVVKLQSSDCQFEPYPCVIWWHPCGVAWYTVSKLMVEQKQKS
jgi:hypothetical protein